MAETSLINVVAIHATASTAAPTLPSKLSNISQTTWSTAGFETIGSVNINSNDMDLDEDTIAPTFERIYEPIEPPRSFATEDKILLKMRLEPFEFVCYGGPEALFTLDSNLSITTNKATETGTTTKRTVAIEISGLALWYFPSCIVSVIDESGGFASGGVTKARMRVEPLRTATYPAGFYKEWYQ